MRYLIGFLLLANVAFFFLYPAVDSETVYLSRLPALPQDIKPVVLLSERKLVAPAQQPVKAAQQISQLITIDANTTLSEALLKKRFCLTMGPLSDKGQANTLSDWLGEQQYEFLMRTGNVTTPAGYWVYLPAMPADHAHAIVADLEEQGVSDYYLGKNYMISLGVYSDQYKAAVRQEQLLAMGYEAKLGRHYRPQQVYWLDVEGAGQPLQTSPAWQSFVQESPGITVRQARCE